MTWQIFFFLVALILFVLHGISAVRPWAYRDAFIGIGLAFFVAGFLQPLVA